MSDYDIAMMHVELAFRRTASDLRKKGDASIEDALFAVAEELATLAEEARQSKRDATS